MLQTIYLDAQAVDCGPDSTAGWLHYQLLVGTDGAGSMVRAAMQEQVRVNKVAKCTATVLVYLICYLKVEPKAPTACKVCSQAKVVLSEGRVLSSYLLSTRRRDALGMNQRRLYERLYELLVVWLLRSCLECVFRESSRK